MYDNEPRTISEAVQMKLFENRVVWLASSVNTQSATEINAQLLALDQLNQSDITLYINSPGGCVASGLSIVDTMRFIKSPVNTVVCGTAASMGAIILACGDSRASLKHSRVMIHQVSSGFHGNFTDIQVQVAETAKLTKILYQILSDQTGKSYEEIQTVCEKSDKWFSAQEALDYNLIDTIVESQKGQ